jgi:hypothetical protein
LRDTGEVDLITTHVDSKQHQGRITWAFEELLQLPVLVVLAGLWLSGVAFISLFGLASFYVLIYLLGIVSGA